MEQQHIDFFLSLLGPEQTLSGPAISSDYGRDESGLAPHMPELVLRARSEAEISSILAYANEWGLPVTVRGGGTGQSGGAVAVFGGLLLDVTAMDRILEIDPVNMTAIVEPGVLLMDLVAAVERQGLMYGPDPGEKGATLGGNISTNAGGMRAVKYGVTRDYVRALRAVLADGRILETGGKLVKNSTGYSLKDLIVGSEGTLAVVTQITLKLLPLPPVQVSLVVPFPDMDGAVDAVPLILSSGVLPTGAEFFQRELLDYAELYLGKKFPCTGYGAYLILSFDGREADSVEKEWRFVADLCLKLGAIDVFLIDTPERSEHVWRMRDNFTAAMSGAYAEFVEYDLVVPRADIGGLLRYTAQVAEETGVGIFSYGHAGDGNVHVNFCRRDMSDQEWEEKRDQAVRLVFAQVARLGGLPSGEHGIGYTKQKYMDEFCGATAMSLMAGIKRTFDPKGILNPGKVVAGSREWTEKSALLSQI